MQYVHVVMILARGGGACEPIDDVAVAYLTLVILLAKLVRPLEMWRQRAVAVSLVRRV